MDDKVTFPFPDGDFSRMDARTGFPIWEVTTSVKEGTEGNFVDPTPYFFARTRLSGAISAEALVCREEFTDWGGPPRWIVRGEFYSKQDFPMTVSTPTAFTQSTQQLVNVLKSAAARELLTAVGKELADFDTVTEVAEVRETVSFLRDTTRSLAEFVFYVWRRNPIKALRSLGIYSPRKRDQRWTMRRINHWASQGGTVEDACSDIWLKYRYAMMPTLYSGNDLLKALAGYSNDVIPTRSQASYPGREYQEETDPRRTASGCYFSRQIRRFYRLEASVRASGYWKGLRDVLDSIRGTRLLDYAQTAWELVPFSFVVDWFVDLSTYMDNQRTDARLVWSRGQFAIKAVEVSAYAADFQLVQNTSTDRYSGGFCQPPRTSVRYKTFYFKREPWSSSPSGYLNLPSYDPNYNFRRFLDTCAFTLKALKGRLKYRWYL